MRFSNAFAIGCTFVFSTGMVLPLCAADPLSDSERLQNLEKAVRQLQQRNAKLEKGNAELEKEVQQLKAKGGPFAPIFAKPEEKAVAGNANKAVFTAPSPPPVDVHPGGSEYKLTLGGFRRMWKAAMSPRSKAASVRLR